MKNLTGHSTSEIRTWLQEQQLLERFTAQIGLPLVPLPDNFTAPTRTPWGGTKILGIYKRDLPIRPEKQYPIIGEAWEISADPTAPGQFVFDLQTETVLLDFIQLLELFPEQILGARLAAKFNGQNPILVKLLDAADHLSVQVHPDDSYAGLGADESGKPESWYILEAEPGAGLFFGLRADVTPARLREAILKQADVSQLLNFVPVQPGDFFVIDAGTIHAIGAGVTLIEPQKIAPRKSGKTYRVWDWNRKYDAQGRLDPQGTARELHLEDSLNIVRFDDLRGQEFIQRIQPQPRVSQQHGASQELVLTETENFGVSRIQLEHDDALQQNCTESFHGLIVSAGRLRVMQHGRQLAEIARGQAVILPASLQTYTLMGQYAQAIKVYYPAQYLA